MVSSCCSFCPAQHSLANIKSSSESEFTSAIKPIFTYIFGFQPVEDFSLKYVCLDCIIQIHNYCLFLIKAKHNVKKLTKKNLNGTINNTDKISKHLEKDNKLEAKICDDLKIICNWVITKAGYLKKLDAHLDVESQTEPPYLDEEHLKSQSSQSVTDVGVQTERVTRRSLPKKNSSVIESALLKVKKTVKMKNGAEADPKKKRKRGSDTADTGDSEQTKKKAKVQKKEKESRVKVPFIGEKLKRRGKSKDANLNKLAIDTANRLDIQLKLAAEALHVQMTPPHSEGLLTPSDSLLISEQNRDEGGESKIDICDSDVKQELTSPSGENNVPAFGTPRTKSLLSVIRSEDVLKVCGLCELAMYSQNEVKKHRKVHMQCTYCKKKFRSFKSTYAHSNFECMQNPTVCNVYIDKVDQRQHFSEKYPVAVSQLKHMTMNVAKKKTSSRTTHISKVQ